MTGWIRPRLDRHRRSGRGRLADRAAAGLDQLRVHRLRGRRGHLRTPDGAKNAIILGAILVIFATVINMLGVKVMSRINNFGVLAELIGATPRDPACSSTSTEAAVVTNSLGLGARHSWGYLGAFLIGGIMSAYVMYGFDTAGTLARKPTSRAAPHRRRSARAPRAALIGGLLILFAVMDVRNIHDANIGLLGLPYIVKQALGNTAGNVFLVDSALAITVCTLAIETACIRLLFAMARDGRLPFGTSIARVSGPPQVPIVPALVTGILTLALLAVNIADQSAFVTLTSVAIMMFYISTWRDRPMLLQRLRGQWPRRPRLATSRSDAGAAGERARRDLRRGGRVQHRLAARRGLRQRPLVLPGTAPTCSSAP